ncbi:MAG: hypothetical protein JNK73_13625 [Bacteroidia bacterium]|nr:hypothetical protein [Bacteroidia bacterium]
MKHLFFLHLCLFSLLPLTQKAQSSSVIAGKNILNIQYTVMDITRMYYKNVEYTDANNLKLGGFAPIGLVFEHVVSEKFGFGLEFSYGQTTISYTQKTNTYSYSSKTYNYSLVNSTLSMGLRMNFHFVNTRNYNAYSFLTSGYRSVKNVYSSDQPEYNNHTEVSPFPIGIKAGIGLRYFSGNMGIYTEIALASQFLNFGLSFKL